jgi:hypothetical protein
VYLAQPVVCEIHNDRRWRLHTKFPTNRYEDYHDPPRCKRFSGATRKSTALCPSFEHEAGRGPRARIIDLDSLSVEASISPVLHLPRWEVKRRGTYTGIASCGTRQHGTGGHREYPEAETPERNDLDWTLCGQTWTGSTGQTPGWVKEG